MEIVSFLYYLFIISTLFFSCFFLLIHFETWHRLKRDPIAKNPRKLSILVPAYNEEKSLGETLKCLMTSSYPKKLLEIIVINDGSKDRTLEIIKEWHKKYPKIIKYIDQRNQGKAKALNNALKIAKGEFIAVIDADSFPLKNAMMRMMGIFEKEPDVAAITSNIQVKQRNTFLRRIQDIEYTMIIWIRKLLQHIEAVYVTPGPLSMYNAKLLRKVGGFDVKNITEDIEIAWRFLSKGYKIRIALDAKVLTNAPRKFSAWWKQRVRWGAGGIQTFMKYRKLIFNRKYGTFGVFVIPFFAYSIFISILGLSIVIYRTFGEIIYDLYYSIASKFVSISGVKEFFIVPNSFTFFGIVLLIVVSIYLLISLLSMGNKRQFNITQGGIFALVFFTIFYVSLFPLVLIHAFYRVARGNWIW